MFESFLPLFSFADKPQNLYFRRPAGQGELLGLSQIRCRRQHHHICANIIVRAGRVRSINFFGPFARVARCDEGRSVRAVAGQLVDFLAGNK